MSKCSCPIVPPTRLSSVCAIRYRVWHGRHHLLRKERPCCRPPRKSCLCCTLSGRFQSLYSIYSWTNCRYSWSQSHPRRNNLRTLQRSWRQDCSSPISRTGPDPRLSLPSPGQTYRRQICRLRLQSTGPLCRYRPTWPKSRPSL